MATRGRPKKTKSEIAPNFLDKISREAETNQSRLSMVLGILIVLVVGILIFNYFNKPKPSLGPAQQTTAGQSADVTPGNLPGKYTVKDGDTLFNIAQTYYKDGYQYPEIAKANSLTNPDLLETGQVLTIPKLSVSATQVSTGNVTVWGPKIEGDSYTVADGDWLSTIAGRAYGDVMAFQKIADANGIADPNLIEPGMVLKIPR